MAKGCAAPLQAPCPDTFGGMPEWFLDDVLDVLLYVARFAPRTLVVGEMDEIMAYALAYIPESMGEIMAYGLA